MTQSKSNPGTGWDQVAAILGHLSCLREARRCQRALVSDLSDHYDKSKSPRNSSALSAALALKDYLDLDRTVWRELLGEYVRAAMHGEQSPNPNNQPCVEAI